MKAIQEAIAQIIGGQTIGAELAERVAMEIFSGEATPAQIGGLLVGLRVRGETLDQIGAFARAMRRMATPVDADDQDNLLDTCGTGGMGSRKFNISTAAAIVAAGAGARVAKHGNRAVTSQAGSGSADVLAALGVKIDPTPEVAAHCLRECGMAFFFAPAYHKAMAHAGPPRREIGVRSIFNLLGPMANPAGARRQLVGVGAPELQETYARVLSDLGALHVMVVHGEDGLDEISLAAPTRIIQTEAGGLKSYTLRPEDLGLKACKAEDLAGGADADERAGIVRRVLQGEPGPRRQAVELNAAAALITAGKAGDWQDGLCQASAAIDSGAALGVLEKLVELSNAEVAA